MARDRTQLGYTPPPGVLDAESSVLGSVLLRNEALTKVNGLQPEHFYDPRHEVVFEAMKALEGRASAIDVVTLEKQIGYKLPAIGGLVFLSTLLHVVPHADNVAHYAEIVEDHGRLIMLRRALLDVGGDAQLSFEEMLSRSARIVERARTGVELPLERPRPARLVEVIGEILLESNLPLISTGLPAFDAALGGGLSARGIHAIVAGSGKGKTSLAAQITAHHSEHAPAGYYSGELTRAQLAARVIAQRTGLSWRDVLRGRVPLEVMRRILEPLEFDVIKRSDNPIAAITESADEMIGRKRGMPLLTVDYVQLLADLGKDPRIGTMIAMRSLTSIVESRDIVLVVLAQGSRASSRFMRERQSQSSEDYVDVAAETAQIERDATTMVVLTYHSAEGVSTHEVTAMVAKQRFGGRCKVGLKYHGPSGKWEDLGHEPAPVTSATEKKRQNRIDAILKAVEGNRAKLTKTEIRSRVGGDASAMGKVIDQLVEYGKLMVLNKVREEGGGQRSARDVYDLTTPENARVPGEDDDK